VEALMESQKEFSQRLNEVTKSVQLIPTKLSLDVAELHRNVSSLEFNLKSTEEKILKDLERIEIETDQKIMRVLDNFGLEMGSVSRDMDIIREESATKIATIESKLDQVLQNISSDQITATSKLQKTEVVIQRRGRFSMDPFMFRAKRWIDYEEGFGDASKEFWLGLKEISSLTSEGQWELIVNLKSRDLSSYRAVYNSFSVGGPPTYTMRLGSYNSDRSSLEDSLSHHNNAAFSTYDKDNDQYSAGSCAQKYHGAAWWFKDCTIGVNLNGRNPGGDNACTAGTCIHWTNTANDRGQGDKFAWPHAEMKIVRIK